MTCGCGIELLKAGRKAKVFAMKKITSILTAATLSMTMCTTGVMAAQFSDIEDERYSWAKPYIEDMADQGYINGYEDGTFGPDNEVTKLECIAMFARAMGALNDANATVLEKAHAAYDDLLMQYSLSWGQDELAYLLYKGVFDEVDLNTYIKDVKNEPMKRYEAAIIITKAMNGEDTALSQAGVSLDYADAKTIPTAALGYVAYASDKGIMNGMDDGSFSPHTSVLRSQMAVMLARVVDQTGYDYVEAKLVSVDTEKMVLVLQDEVGNQTEYSYTDDTQFMIMGSSVKAEYMLTNVAVTCALQDGVVANIDSHSGEADVTITGKYQGSATSGGRVMIKLIPTGSSSTQTYYCADELTVTYDGRPATMRSFATGDLMTIDMSDGFVYAVRGQEQEYVIENAVVKSVDIEDVLTMTISHASDEYDGAKLIVGADAIVRKNNLPTDFSDIYPGDSVTITMQYGEVAKVVATSSIKTYEGSVQSVSIATQSSMTVRVNGEDMTYIVASDTPITKDGKDITLYDLRVGDIVKITTESDAITKIACTGAVVSEDGRVSGVVAAVNTSLGFVKINNGTSEVSETVFCNDTKTKIITKTGTTKNMKALQTDMKISAYGTVSSGAFIATLIVIED